MVNRGIIGAMALLVTLPAVMPAFADATLTVQGSDGLESAIQVRNGRGRMSSAGIPGYLVFDAGSRNITYVEPDQQRYTQATAEELQSGIQAAANIRDSIAPYMDDLLAGLPAEQRSKIEQRMGAVLGAPAAGSQRAADQLKTVARGTYTIAGLSCQASGILKNGRPAAEVCMATGPGGSLSKQDYATLAEMISVSRSLATGARGMLGDVADRFEFLTLAIEGVPLAVRDLEHGRRYQVKAVSNAALPDTLFNSYETFQRQELAALLRQ